MLLTHKYKSLSIIGNYKNVGKTTTLNYIINEAEGLTLGLTSIGVDGEEEDIVTKTKKPRIYVRKGSIIATAKTCLLKSDITKEILETTSINTPLGEIVIFKALSNGYIELCGPSINTQIKMICDKLHYLGSDLTIVDGALSRKTLASPSVTEASIFCTGAVVDKNINKVVEKTIHEVNMITIDKINDDNIYEIYEELNKTKISIINKDYTIKDLELKTALNSHEEVEKNLEDNSKYIFINGIINNSFIENLIKITDKYKSKTILVKDGTKIFLDKLIYDKYICLGGDIKVVDEINLIGISINPTSPQGYIFDSEDFVRKLSKHTKIPVFNVQESLQR